MPIHDWTRVVPNRFHDFHHSLIEEIERSLNSGGLPSGYYPLAEQTTPPMEPDVLSLQATGGNGVPNPDPDAGPPGLKALALAPPRVRFTAQTDVDLIARKQKSVVIRHSTDDRIIAIIEVVSPGNKRSRRDLDDFLAKVIEILTRGMHLLLADLQPPTARDPDGIHGVIWSALADAAYQRPGDKPLTLASYAAGTTTRAFVEPVAVGDVLPDMPLFLEPESYVTVPLEKTYMTAFREFPKRWRSVLEA